MPVAGYHCSSSFFTFHIIFCSDFYKTCLIFFSGAFFIFCPLCPLGKLQSRGKDQISKELRPPWPHLLFLPAAKPRWPNPILLIVCTSNLQRKSHPSLNCTHKRMLRWPVLTIINGFTSATEGPCSGRFKCSFSSQTTISKLHKLHPNVLWMTRLGVVIPEFLIMQHWGETEVSLWEMAS